MTDTKKKIIIVITVVVMVITVCAGLFLLFNGGTEAENTPTEEPSVTPIPSANAATNVKNVSLNCDKELNVYTQGQDVTLVFTADAEADGTVDITYTVTNISTNESIVGRAVISAGSRTAEAKLTLSSGVYQAEIRASSGTDANREFITVLLNDDISGGERFAMDFASTWHLSSRDRAKYIEMLKLAGIDHVRERISISDTTLPDGTGAVKSYEAALNTLKESGFDTIITWHDLPDSMKNGSGVNLLAVYKQLKSLVASCGDKISAWEIWNEQDVIHFGTMYPDEYAAYLKACAIAIDDSGTGALKVLGAFARTPSYSKFGKWMMENGVMDYVDVYNFHVYTFTTYGQGLVTDFDVVREHLDFAAQYGGTAAWQTETGTIHSEIADNRSMDSLAQQAKYWVISAVQSAAMGVQRTYPFLLIPYAGEDNLSFFALGGYAYPAYGAYATMIKMLGDCNINGILQDGGTTGYSVSRKDGKQAAVLFKSDGPGQIKISADKPLILTDMYGSQRVLVPNDGIVTVNTGNSPVYISREDGTLPEGLFKDYSVDYAVTEAKSITEAQRVVLWPHFAAENAPDMPTKDTVATGYEGVNSGYRFNKGESAEVTVTVYNFNNEPASGTVGINMPAGWKCADAARSVTVQANASAEITFKITAGSGINAGTLEKITFYGTFGGNKTSDCVSWVSGRD